MVVTRGSLKDVLVMEFDDLDCTVLLERNTPSSLVCCNNIKAVLENLQYSVRMTVRCPVALNKKYRTASQYLSARQTFEPCMDSFAMLSD